MKKIILASLLLSSSFLAKSQEGPFVSFNTGVAFAATPDALGVTTVTTSSGDFTNTNIYGTFGNGLQFSLRGGFKMSQNFGFELGVSYLSGFNSTVRDATGPNSSDIIKAKSTQVNLKPGVLFETSNDALTLYSRMGFVLPVGGKTTVNQETEFTGTQTNIKTENTGAFSLGYFGGAGVSIKMGDNLKVFVEVESVNLRIKQKTSVITEYSVDGSDQLSSLSTQNKETEYVDAVSSSDNTDINQPRKILANTTNFSSFGFNVGVRFNF